MLIYNRHELPAEMKASAATNKAAWIPRLQQAFDTAINSDVFMSFEEKIDTLFDAMRIPISDDQSYNQFFIHSTKDLESEAGRKSATSGTICIMPTLDQIHVEARKRYDEKAAKLQRQADKRAAKAAKTQPTPAPTPQVAQAV